MHKLQDKKAFISDMDGVIYHGNNLLPGAIKFINWLKENDKKYLFLTNSSERSPRELSQKLARLGVDVDETHFYTSALSTASFLAQQKPGGSVFVIGEAGLIQEKIEDAVGLVQRGAMLIGTNPDLTGPTERGIVPATGALVKPIELATGKTAYFLGKPNPLMMRHAVKLLGTTPEETVIIGDRMDTDILAGIESEFETVLVLSGVTTRQSMTSFGYRPTYVLDGVGDIPTYKE